LNWRAQKHKRSRREKEKTRETDRRGNKIPTEKGSTRNQNRGKHPLKKDLRQASKRSKRKRKGKREGDVFRNPCILREEALGGRNRTYRPSNFFGTAEGRRRTGAEKKQGGGG